jgi:hypothetical protein
MDTKKMYNYIWRTREKVLKLYLIELYEKYQNILSQPENNFLDEDIVAIIDPNYKLIVEKLNLTQCKLNKDQIQIGGNFNNVQYSPKQQYIQQINILQQKIFALASNNVFLTQQLQQCNLDKRLMSIEKSSMADKLLFFDKSLETVANAISNNISNGNQRLNILSEFVKSKKSDNVGNIDIGNIRTDTNETTINLKITPSGSII